MLNVDKTNYTFDKDKVLKIISEFEKQFKSNTKVINKAVSTDEKLSLTNLDIDLLKSTFKNTDIPIMQSSKLIVDGIGNIGVIYTGNPYITLYLSLAALRTHNKICFFVNDSCLATNNLIVNMLNKIIEQFNYGKDIIKLYNNTAEKEIIESEKLFNMLIYIGDKYEYVKFKKKTSIPITYNGYENAIFYIEAAEKFNNTLVEINNYVFKHNIGVETFRNDYIEAVESINENSNNDLVVLFTSNKITAKYFVENVKCKKLVINQNPFEEYIFEFDEGLLVQKKEIVF